jgi:hypothetical protein
LYIIKTLQNAATYITATLRYLTGKELEDLFDLEVLFESAGIYASSLRLYSYYLEYSEVPNTSLQSVGFILVMASFIVGVASLLILTVQAKKT